jgi:hypothetical protein
MNDDWKSFQVPFVCMLGANEDEEMDQFYIVNSKLSRCAPTSLTSF